MKQSTLRDEIRAFVAPFYAKNDAAHHIDHADMVCDLGLELNQFMGLTRPKDKQEETLILLAAYFHDIYAIHREEHHVLAFNFVDTSKDGPLGLVSPSDKYKVARACLEHRASFKGLFFSPLSELISSADRGKPDLDHIKQRSRLFYLSRHAKGTPEDEALAQEHVKTHLKRKYSKHGYANRPEIYQAYFKTELLAMQKEIEQL